MQRNSFIGSPSISGLIALIWLPCSTLSPLCSTAFSQMMNASVLLLNFRSNLLAPLVSSTIDAFNTGPLGLEMIDLAFQTQHLAQGGPLQVSIEVGAGPERSFFHPTAGLADGLRLSQVF